MNISIIIPVLNEENSIAKLLNYLQEIKNSDYTKIVLDCDNSEAILSKLGMA